MAKRIRRDLVGRLHFKLVEREPEREVFEVSLTKVIDLGEIHHSVDGWLPLSIHPVPPADYQSSRALAAEWLVDAQPGAPPERILLLDMARLRVELAQLRSYMMIAEETLEKLRSTTQKVEKDMERVDGNGAQEPRES